MKPTVIMLLEGANMMPYQTKRKPGKPTKLTAAWDATIPERAYELCLLGLKDIDLATAFGVSVYSIDKWKQVHPEFKEALRRGKEQADANVAQALYHKAVGYSHKVTEIKIIDGEVIKVPTIKAYPPDTTACIFWLKNRQRQAWTDTKQHSHTGKLEMEHKVRNNLDLSDFSKEELALAEKLAGRMLSDGEVEDVEWEEGAE
jgi:hypothetical protein